MKYISLGMAVSLIVVFSSILTASPADTIAVEGKFKIEESSQFGAITAMEWNGSTWLLGTSEGGILSYDGKSFFYFKKLNNTIKDINWVNGSWLIHSGQPDPYSPYENTLTRYDGKFTALLEVRRMMAYPECSQHTCLIDVTGTKEAEPRLLRYDGMELVDLNLSSENLGIGRQWSIGHMLWNGEYWLIYLKALKVVEGPAQKDKEWIGYIFKYEGQNFTKLFAEYEPLEFFEYFTWETVGVYEKTALVPREGSEPLQPLGWNGNYWLMQGTGKGGEGSEPRPELFKYDGQKLTPMNVSLSVFERKNDIVLPTYRMVKWNGEYWLMDNGFVLAKFDGSDFKVIEERAYWAVLPPKPVFGIKMMWNGEYWLSWYRKSGGRTGGHVLGKIEDDEFEWLSYEPLTKSSHLWPPIGDVEWNGEYWLIGGILNFNSTHPVYDGSPILVKYDGQSFEDLTSNESAKARPPEKKPLCGPNAILLVSLLVPAVLGLKRLR